MVIRLILPLGIAASLASCSVLIDVDGKQCSVDADCVGFGSAVCEQNLCVESGGDAGASSGGASGEGERFVCEEPEPSEEPSVIYSFAPIFASPPSNPQPFTIKACGQLDFDCENPVFGPIEVNAEEPQDFEVPRSFAGYFEVRNPDTLPGLVFLSRPVTTDTVGWNVTMPGQSTVVQLALATGEDVDPDLGVVLSVARDCSAAPVSGVTFESSEGGLGYYIFNNLPSTTITETGDQGAAGFVNIPLGITILSGTHTSGAKLGPVSVRVKQGFISLVELFP